MRLNLEIFVKLNLLDIPVMFPYRLRGGQKICENAVDWLKLEVLPKRICGV